mmetsp:Transcript_771/g.2186  ORF Transcript_771/g.2186 Transcript_771/m.2186 type:complete len:97 (-) Transcript_771:347-637(-)
MRCNNRLHRVCACRQLRCRSKAIDSLYTGETLIMVGLKATFCTRQVQCIGTGSSFLWCWQQQVVSPPGLDLGFEATDTLHLPERPPGPTVNAQERD